MVVVYFLQASSFQREHIVPIALLKLKAIRSRNGKLKKNAGANNYCLAEH